MQQKEVNEIKKVLTAKDCCIQKIVGCCVDPEKNLHTMSMNNFLTLQEECRHKYFDLIKKGLSGKVGKNLINAEFSTIFDESSSRQLLDGIVKAELKDDELNNRLFASIRDNYAYIDNYYIMMIYGVYDVPGITNDGIMMEDASDEIYRFILTLICPMKPSKAGLMYDPVEESIENAIRTMMIEPPMHGFLYPSFTDRVPDIHNVLYYTQKPNELNDTFIEHSLDCNKPATATSQNEMFISAVEAIEELTFDKAKAIYSNVRELELEKKNEEQPDVVVDKRTSERVLEDSGLKPEEIEVFTQTFESQTKENGDILLTNVFGGSNKLKIKSGKTEVSIPIESTDFVDVRNIDGKNCIVIEINDELTVNGVKINKFELGQEV